MSLIRKITNRALWALPSSGTIRGYGDGELVDFIRAKALTYRDFEPWPEIRGAASVLDFGGGFGLHYRRAALELPDVRWAIVETPETFMRTADFASDRLRFFTEIEAACCWLGPVDVTYSNAALQFTSEPERYLSELCAVNAKKMIWDRILLSNDRRSNDAQISLLAENGPGLSFSRKRVEVPLIRIPEADFLAAHRSYRLTKRAGKQDDRSGEDFVFTKFA